MKLGLQDIDVAGRTVFLRVDYNVPLDGQRITDDSRIQASLPTVTELRARGAKLIVASHLGRPKGTRDPRYSIQPVARRLGELLGCAVDFVDDCVGVEVSRRSRALESGAVLMLENLRYHVGEEADDGAFARSLAELAPIYVNDAFGACHRAHASVHAITNYVEFAAAGRLLEREVASIMRVREAPERPFLLIVGGAKVADKIPVVEGLLPLIQDVAVGGAMALTFLRAKGFSVGRSRVEIDRVEQVQRMLKAAEDRGVRIHLPADHVVAAELGDDVQTKVVVNGSFPADSMGLDIGPVTRAQYSQLASAARTIVWNGPMGVFEVRQFAVGTDAVARSVADSSAYSVVGGGDSVAALKAAGASLTHGHVSTGGGATLELLSGVELPGVRALHDRSR